MGVHRSFVGRDENFQREPKFLIYGMRTNEGAENKKQNCYKFNRAGVGALLGSFLEDTLYKCSI